MGAYTHTQKPCHTPLVTTAELLHLPTQAGSSISCLPLPIPPTPSVPLFEQGSWAVGVTGELSRLLVLNDRESMTIFWPLLEFSFPPKHGLVPAFSFLPEPETNA